MKHLKKYNEMLDPMGSWDQKSDKSESDIDTGIFSESTEEGEIKSLINSGKRIEVIGIENFKDENGKISFDLDVIGVWMGNEKVLQVRQLLLRKFDNVEVIETKGKTTLHIIITK